MDRVVPTLIVAAVIVGVFALMWRGWSARQRAQAGIAEPLRPAPEATNGMAGEPGMYVVTTYAEQPLERVSVHGLGLRTTAELFAMDDGALFRLSGVPDLFIPAADIVSVHTAAGMIGKFVEPEGLIVIRWRLGDQLLDTGFRPRSAAAGPALIAALNHLIEED